MEEEEEEEDGNEEEEVDEDEEAGVGPCPTEPNPNPVPNSMPSLLAPYASILCMRLLLGAVPSLPMLPCVLAWCGIVLERGRVSENEDVEDDDGGDERSEARKLNRLRLPVALLLPLSLAALAFVFAFAWRCGDVGDCD